MRAGSSPTSMEPICRSIAVRARFAIFVVVVISPQPVIPSSVFTSTNRNSPQYEALDFISQGRTLVIFICFCFLQ